MGSIGATDRRAMTPNTVSVEWTIGPTTYTLTDNGEGLLTGNGSGSVEYGWGGLSFRPNPAPRPSDGDYTVSYDKWNAASKLTDSVAPTQSSITRTLPGAPLKAGSLVIKAKMIRLREFLDHKKMDYSAPVGDERREYKLDGVAHDDGNGNLLRDGVNVGTVNYTTGEVTFDMRLGYQYQKLKQETVGFAYSAWEQVPASATEDYDTSVNVEFYYGGSADPVASETVTIPIEGIQIDLIPGNGRPIIAGSLLFSFGGKTYRDRQGAIITDWSSTTDAGTNVGSIDYSTGIVTLNDWAAGADLTQAPQILACLTWKGERTSNFSKFRTAGAPLRQGSLILNAVTESGEEVVVQAANDGSITHAKITAGQVDAETGIVSIEWAEPVFPTSVKYSAVAYKYLPLDPDLLGLNPTRLPSDGRVPIFLPGDVGVFSHTIETEVASPTAGATLTFTRDHQAEVWVKGANGLFLDPVQYTLDREAGVLTWADPLTLETDEDTPQAVTTPLTVYDRVEDMVLITDVQISGLVGFNAPLSQNYPAGEAVLSSAVLHGDLRARVYNLFHQASWTGAWSDERIGSDTTAKYNEVAYPLEITNQGSIKERWRISFTSSTNFQVVGESVGVIGTGNTSADCAIANPATGAPYFTIRADGWGTGWDAGNQVRFNTDGAQAPFWIARTILSGPATAEEDSFATQNRGDAD
ncbi:hypothetical protein [Spongiibacter sp. UBA1325]|uniref:hypothetical protein n=1 Tax=Spongiibacter sp. UBA1325 TaxID=1947543 RepID=UPI00257E632F|nr:hypothetical protein [Spongiibacter sp. UBA1325]|tara:strand:- start:9090 stop:11174 length:2085 start_codon:yes stop_codon:yes gene_type:complete